MNQRIQKLYEQAQDEVVDSDCADYYERIQLKFAELIVGECVGVAVDNGCGDFVDIEHLLLKHFEVEQ